MRVSGLHRDRPHSRGSWLGLAVLVTAAMLDLMDGTVVNVILPEIASDLAVGTSDPAIIATSYTIAFAGLLVVGGAVGDYLGTRKVLIVGLLVFICGSLLCLVADSVLVLVIGRVLQGASSAVIVPQALVFIHTQVPKGLRAKALAVYAGITGAGTVVSPVIAGLLTGWNVLGLGWRSIFAVHLALGVMLICSTPLIPVGKVEGVRPKLGVPLLGAIALAGLVHGLLRVGGFGLDKLAVTSFVVAVSAAGVVAAAICWSASRTTEVRNGAALLDVRSFRSALIVNAVVFAVVFGLFFVIPLTLQMSGGQSVLGTSLIILPWACAIPVASAFASKTLVPRFGGGTVWVGSSLMGIGLLLAGVSGVGVFRGSIMWVALFLGLAGLGMGCLVAVVFGLGLRDIPSERAGMAAGVLNAVQQVAGAIGIALTGALYARVNIAGEFGRESLSACLSIAGGIVLLLIVLGRKRSWESDGEW